MSQAEYDAQEHPDCYAREPGEWPCIDCGADVGERYDQRRDMYVADRSCGNCDEPLCRSCQDKAAELIGVDNDMCAKCALPLHPPAETEQKP
jgi:hypothetical protein